MIVFILTCVCVWITFGAIAYFHSVYRDKRDFAITHPFFIKDGFFYNSLLHGLKAFSLEFL